MPTLYSPLSLEACKDRLDEHSAIQTFSLNNYYRGLLLRDGQMAVHEYLPDNRIKLRLFVLNPSFKKRVGPDHLFCQLKELGVGTKIEVMFDYRTRDTFSIAVMQALLITMGLALLMQQSGLSFQPVCFGLFLTLLPLTYYGYGKFRRWQGRQAEAWMLNQVGKIFLASPV